MADRTFASLVPRVNPSVPGCPYPMIVSYIRDAAIRACERTLFWRYQVPLFNLQPGVSEYLYNKPTNTDVHVMFAAVVNERPLERLTMEKAIELYPQWADLYSGQDPAVAWSMTPPTSTFNAPEYNEVQFNDQPTYVVPDEIVADASTPQSITQVTPDKYIILPLPDAMAVYRCRMFLALKPKKNATGMDELIFDELEEVIMHGALQHLLVLPNTNWSDRELAAYHAKQFVYQCSERRARINLGNMRGMMRVQIPPFGA
jgi:hypothetical protein